MSVPKSLVQTWLCFFEYALKLTKCSTLSFRAVKSTNPDHKTKESEDSLIQYCRKSRK